MREGVTLEVKNKSIFKSAKKTEREGGGGWVSRETGKNMCRCNTYGTHGLLITLQKKLISHGN